MTFCSNCGNELVNDAKFCSSCGKSVGEFSKSEQRKTMYDGTIHKCPNCGEILNGFVGNCPACGYELRGTEGSIAIKEFAAKLVNAENMHKKTAIIRNFPVPNTKEDILEFMIMAISNIEDEGSNDILDAWNSKLEQIYQKACIVFTSESEFARINSLHNQAMEKLKKGKNKQKVRNAGSAIAELLPVLPNTLLIVGWLLSIFVLIPSCGVNLDNVGTNGTQLLLMFDFIIGAIIIPFALKCPSHLPRLVTVLGLILSIVVIIPQCSKNLDNVGTHAFQLILIVDIICSAVVFVRMLKASSKIENKDKLNGTSIIFALVSIGVLFVAFFISSIVTSIGASNAQKENDRLLEEKYSMQYEWPPSGLSTYLPRPESVYGKVETDNETRFNIELYKISRSDFDNYVKACEEKGFNISITKTDGVFYAYNGDECSLDMFYDEDEETLELFLDAPLPMEEIKWPNNDLTKRIPKPNSLIGNIRWNNSENFGVYIDDITAEEYEEYVDKCIEAGFSIDYSRGEKTFSATDADGYKIVVEKHLFEQMYISIKVPER